LAKSKSNFEEVFNVLIQDYNERFINTTDFKETDWSTKIIERISNKDVYNKNLIQIINNKIYVKDYFVIYYMYMRNDKIYRYIDTNNYF
jgi:hypothetical protein